MNLQEIIKLVKEIEDEKEGQVIGFHLHQPLGQLTGQLYGRNGDKKFSEVLEDLERHEPV